MTKEGTTPPKFVLRGKTTVEKWRATSRNEEERRGGGGGSSKRGEEIEEKSRACVCVCARTETRKPSHQLKRTRFDGVAENNGRIGVQKRGRERKMGRYAEGRVAWRGRFWRGLDAREIQNPYIKTHSPAGALNSKQYNERGNALLLFLLLQLDGSSTRLFLACLIATIVSAMERLIISLIKF